jgi:hypothetical protein
MLALLTTPPKRVIAGPRSIGELGSNKCVAFFAILRRELGKVASAADVRRSSTWKSI